MINEISNRKRSTRNTVKCLVDRNGRKLSEPLQIANCLNEHFSSVGEKMAEKFVDMENGKDPLDFIGTLNAPPADFYATSEDEVKKLIQSLENKKASGFDLISNRILKSTCETILPYITSLFNACIKKGVFPNCFKIAQVVPLFKGGDKENPSCYRPISLLPSLGKLLEKIVSFRALDHLNENNINKNNPYP